MKLEFIPSIISGETIAPPSKSIAHRSLICAAFSHEACEIKGIDPSQDVLATTDCLSALGKTICIEEGCACFSNGSLKGGQGICLNCRESGSTIRFFVPICLALGGHFYLYGSERLLARPMEVYEKICRENNIYYKLHEDCIEIDGKLPGGHYTLRSDISSQFITGLIFGLSLIDNDSVIDLIPPVVSRAYIDLTIDTINKFSPGSVMWKDGHTIHVSGGKRFIPYNTTVEGDYSNAAFLDAFNLIGGNVKVNGLKEDSVQGDRVYKEYFDLLKENGAAVDIDECPDLGPVLFAAAAAIHGGKFTGTKRLKIKESDRCEAMKEELAKFGIKCINEENSFTVECGSLKKPDEVLYGHNDHRIVMALSVLLTRTGGIIDGCEAVNKSFPGFFREIEALNADFREI